MSIEKSHIKAGFIFTGVCVAIGIALYLVTIIGSDDENAEPNIAARTTNVDCPADIIGLNLGADKKGGTIELITPVADSHGAETEVYSAQSVTCIPRADLEKMAEVAGLNETDALPIKIGFDPTGTINKYRSRIDYEPDLDLDLSDVPVPPSGMAFGEAVWLVGSDQNSVQISWHKDFRERLEKDARSITEIESEATQIAEPDHDNSSDYSASYMDCMDAGDAAAGVDSAMMECASQELLKQDKRLNDEYRKAMAKATSPQKVKLRDLQRSWIAERDKKCGEFVDTEYPGTLDRLLEVQCILGETADRANWLDTNFNEMK